MELIVLFIVIVCVVWIVWRMLANIRASRRAELDDAWRVVLSDPNYDRRRLHEERKREEDLRRRD